MESLPINIADLGIIAILLISGVLAFFRGLVHEALSIASWVGAGFATLYGLEEAVPYVKTVIASDLVAQIVAGVLIFLIVLILISLISRAVSRRVQESDLGALDRSLGFLFGLLRGAVLISLAWLLLVWLIPPEEHPEWIQEARAKPLVERGASLLQALVPEGTAEDLEESVNEATDEARKAVGDAAKGEASKSIDEALAPKTASEDDQKDTASEGQDGYTEDDTEGMDQLIEGVDESQ